MAIMIHEDFIKTASWSKEDEYFDEQYGNTVKVEIIAFDPENPASVGVKIADNIYTLETIQAVLEDAQRFKKALTAFSTKTEYEITYTLANVQQSVIISASIAVDALSQFNTEYSYDKILSVTIPDTGETVFI